MVSIRRAKITFDKFTKDDYLAGVARGIAATLIADATALILTLFMLAEYNISYLYLLSIVIILASYISLKSLINEYKVTQGLVTKLANLCRGKLIYHRKLSSYTCSTRTRDVILCFDVESREFYLVKPVSIGNVSSMGLVVDFSCIRFRIIKRERVLGNIRFYESEGLLAHPSIPGKTLEFAGLVARASEWESLERALNVLQGTSNL